MRIGTATLAILAVGAPAAAELTATQKVVSSPQVGEERTVAAGEDIYSFYRVYTIQGAQIDADTKAGNIFLEEKLPAGTQLVPVATTKKFKGCVPYEGTFNAKGPCLIDDDGDGKFDRHSADEVTMFRKLKPPVPYSMVPMSLASADSFKRVILYQGATADSLRFSYREFKDDMARPAFTEELTIPREPFPAMLAVKNLRIEAIKVGGLGLTYRIVKVN